MASSGSRACGQRSTVAGADDDAPLANLTNPDLAHLPAADLVVLLHRADRTGSDFADAALVLAARERRLAEAEARIRGAELNAAGLRDTIRALEERVANAEARARDRTVVAGEDDDDESQAGDRLAASDVGAAGGEIRARGLEIVVPEIVCLEAGVEATPAEVEEDDIPSPIPLMRIDAVPFPVPVTPAPALPGELIEDRAVEEVVVDVAVPRSNEVVEAGEVDCQDKVSEAMTRKKKKKPSSDLSLPLDELRRSSMSCEVVHSRLPYPHDDHLDVDNMPSPVPLMRIDAFLVPVTAAPALPDELIEERAVERVIVDVAVPGSNEVAEAEVVDCQDKVSQAIARKRKEPTSDISLTTLDNLRVTGHEVSEEEAYGEDVEASPHRRPQGEQPARATKKARRQETSFYTMVFKALKEKEMLLKKKEKEAIAKKAAASASEELNCRCWWSDAPCLP